VARIALASLGQVRKRMWRSGWSEPPRAFLGHVGDHDRVIVLATPSIDAAQVVGDRLQHSGARYSTLGRRAAALLH